MLKDALEFIFESMMPTEIEIQTAQNTCQKYLLHGKNVIEVNEKNTTLFVKTLEGVLAYVRMDKEKISCINITSPNSISIFGNAITNGSLKTLCKADAKIKEFPFGQKLFVEEFIMNVQVCFKDNEDKQELLASVSKVVSSSSVSSEDDGITQMIEVKSGISLKENKRINPVRKLEAFRSFPGFASPQCDFLFRAHKDENGIKFSLTDMQGDNWIGETIEALRDYLKTNCPSQHII